MVADLLDKVHHTVTCRSRSGIRDRSRCGDNFHGDHYRLGGLASLVHWPLCHPSISTSTRRLLGRNSTGQFIFPFPFFKLEAKRSIYPAFSVRLRAFAGRHVHAEDMVSRAFTGLSVSVSLIIAVIP